MRSSCFIRTSAQHTQDVVEILCHCYFRTSQKEFTFFSPLPLFTIQLCPSGPRASEPFSPPSPALENLLLSRVTRYDRVYYHSFPVLTSDYWWTVLFIIQTATVNNNEWRGWNERTVRRDCGRLWSWTRSLICSWTYRHLIKCDIPRDYEVYCKLLGVVDWLVC